MSSSLYLNKHSWGLLGHQRDASVIIGFLEIKMDRTLLGMRPSGHLFWTEQGYDKMVRWGGNLDVPLNKSTFFRVRLIPTGLKATNTPLTSNFTF